jgi:DedD protein
MGWAFWRSKKRAGNAAAKPATRTPIPSDDVDPRSDPAAVLRTRARHRLIGAAALLLAVAIIVPMVLDPQPRSVPENIPIDIPSERTPFTPRLALPPMPATETTVAPPDQAPAESKAPKPVSKGDEAKAAVEAEKATAALDGKAAPDALPAPVRGGKFAVQVAAPASEKAARELADKLKNGGFAAFVEKVETRDGARYRVRLGPYANRDDADRVRTRLKATGVSGNVVAS